MPIPSSYNAHTLTAFAEVGETRLVYARYRRDPARPLFFLRDGEASAARAMVKAELDEFRKTLK